MDRSAGGLWPKFWERRNLGGHFDQGGGGVGEGHKGGTLAFLPWSFPPPLPPPLSTRFGWFVRASGGGGGGGGGDHKGGAGILALVPLLPFYLSATAQDHLSSKSVKRNSMCPQMKYNDKKIY